MLKIFHLVFLLPLAIYGMWISIIHLYGVNIPILDQWVLPGEQIESFFQNQLSFATLYKQYNESRKLIPNLIFIILAGILKEWNVKAEMLIGLHFAFLMSLLIYFLLLLTNKSFYKNIFILIVYYFLLLSPSSFSRWLRGITIHRLIPDACLIINALIFRLKINQKLKIWLYSFFCIVAQYSFSGGIITWPISLIFIIFNSQMSLTERVKSVCLFILLFGISSSFYFINYSSPSYHTEANEIIKCSWQDIIIYFFAFVGNILGTSYVLSTFIGITLVATFTCLIISNYKSIREELIPWTAIGFYTIALGVLNTITRAPISYTHAMRIDYITHLVYLPLSILVILIYKVKYKKINFLNFYFLSFIGLMTAFYIQKNLKIKNLHELQEWQYKYNYGKSCIQLINFYQKDDCIKALFPFVDAPYPWKLDSVITRFKNLSNFNALQPGIVKELKIYNQGEWGYIDLIQEDPNGFFQIYGWAKLLNKAADAVILAYPDGSNGLIIVDILPIGQMREDVSRQYGLKYINSGWSGNLYWKNNKFTNSPNKCNIQAYSFDANENVLYPLKTFCK